MSTADIAKPKLEQVYEYIPLGETEPIRLTLSRVKQFLCVPTKSGKLPSDEQVIKYIMLCKAQSLNPWVNDAYLVGYDSKDGPTFSLITAHQALLKRAEASPEYDGMESGVIVTRGETLTERAGDLVLNGETLVGGWARVHRNDRSVPSYDALNLRTYDTGRSRWAADPAGQIVKCAEASSLRKAFPSTLAAMYCKEEMERERTIEHVPQADPRDKTSRLAERLTQQTVGGEPIIMPKQEQRETVVVPVVNTPPVEQQSDRIPATCGDYIDRLKSTGSRAELTAITDDANSAWARGEIDAEDMQAIQTVAEERADAGWKP